MAIPDYQSIMQPLLELVGRAGEMKLVDTLDPLAAHFGLTEQERSELYPSGKAQPIFRDRVNWAKTYLKKAGLLTYPQRGVVQVTERGRELLQEKLSRIDIAVLKRFPEFVEFQRPNKEAAAANDSAQSQNDSRTPEELLEVSYQTLRAQLADDLLEQIKSCSPTFFERLVVELLVAMGYGGSLKDAGRATQRSNDGGIDGIIKEDRLGLDTIYIQAKRWEAPVGRPEIQKFAGALQGVRARKGIFITTSSFSNGAAEYVSNIDSKIILIDGEQLAQYMIDYGVGVSAERQFEIKKIDLDYFVEG